MSLTFFGCDVCWLSVQGREKRKRNGNSLSLSHVCPQPFLIVKELHSPTCNLHKNHNRLLEMIPLFILKLTGTERKIQVASFSRFHFEMEVYSGMAKSLYK